MELKKEEFAQLVKDQVGEVITEHNEGFQEEVKTTIAASIVEMQESIKSHALKFQVDPDKKENPSGYKSFAEFAQDVFKCGPSGQGTTESMKSYQKGIKAAGTGMNAFDSESGGYLIPDEFRSTLLSVAIDKTNILQKTMKIPMSSNSIDIPFVSGFDRSGGLVHGGVQFNWLEEEAQRTETKPKLGRIGLKLKKLAGLCYATDEILEDSPISMEPLLKAAFTDALAYTLDGAFLNASGAGTPLGVMNAPCRIEVAKETGQGADTIEWENIINMYSRLWRTAGAVWLANKDTLPQLATMSMPVGTGGVPVWLPANAAAGQPNSTLLGLPVIFSEHCRTVGDAGDLILADWSQYLVGQKTTGLKFASSVHLKFDYDQTAFKFTLRIDGQPWWKSALTPRYSSSTLSPFVTLAERT